MRRARFISAERDGYFSHGNAELLRSLAERPLEVEKRILSCFRVFTRPQKGAHHEVKRQRIIANHRHDLLDIGELFWPTTFQAALELYLEIGDVCFNGLSFDRCSANEAECDEATGKDERKYSLHFRIFRRNQSRMDALVRPRQIRRTRVSIPRVAGGACNRSGILRQERSVTDRGASGDTMAFQGRRTGFMKAPFSTASSVGCLLAHERVPWQQIQ